MSKNSGVIKSSIWYTISNFLVRGMAFITTPIFSRVLTQDEFGTFSNFSSWTSLLTICLTLNLESTLLSAKYDYKDSQRKYVFSILCLSVIGPLLFLLISNIFQDFFVNIFDMKLDFIKLMIVYLCFCPIINIFITWEKFNFKYKMTVAISCFISISSSLLSILFVLLFQDKLFGRIIGFIIPTLIVGFCIFLYFFCKEKRPNLLMWKYAFPICIPFIPHLLSLNVLNSVDRIMITKMCGTSYTALYSVAYSVGAMITILVGALNSSYSPWLGDNLHCHNYKVIRKYSLFYVLFFLWISFFIMLLSPETLYVMGGEKYLSAIHCMPPIAMGCICQFVYCMYVNIEQYKKKTVGMAFASVLAAIINLILNYILIPLFGYTIAAYTTFFSYFVLLIAHIILVKKIKLAFVYQNRKILILVIISMFISIAIDFLYNFTMIRYLVILIYIIITISFIVNFMKKNYFRMKKE